MVDAFEGNKAETHTMLPVIRTFMTTHQMPDATVVTDAGMIAETNRTAIEAGVAVVHDDRAGGGQFGEDRFYEGGQVAVPSRNWVYSSVQATSRYFSAFLRPGRGVLPRPARGSRP